MSICVTELVRLVLVGVSLEGNVCVCVRLLHYMFMFLCVRLKKVEKSSFSSDTQLSLPSSTDKKGDEIFLFPALKLAIYKQEL